MQRIRPNEAFFYNSFHIAHQHGKLMDEYHKFGIIFYLYRIISKYHRRDLNALFRDFYAHFDNIYRIDRRGKSVYFPSDFNQFLTDAVFPASKGSSILRRSISAFKM